MAGIEPAEATVTVIPVHQKFGCSCDCGIDRGEHADGKDGRLVPVATAKGRLFIQVGDADPTDIGTVEFPVYAGGNASRGVSLSTEPIGYDGYGAPIYAWSTPEAPDDHPSECHSPDQG